MKYETERKLLHFIGASLTAILVSIPVFGAGLVVGSCSQRKDETDMEENNETEPAQTKLSDVIVGDVGPDDIKTFDVGEHVLSVRVEYNAKKNDELMGYVVNNIPEGYEVFQITPVVGYGGYKYLSATTGYDIWYKNTEPVEAYATYNDDYEQYGYFTFGEVVENEKTLTK